jgi:outer membrane protein assembly factor BamD (BamD/ComL family)
LYREGQAFNKQALKADYDQSSAGHAIATFTDFMALYPSDARVAEAEKRIVSLKKEQARGFFRIAQFYENARFLDKEKRWKGAVTYYNEVRLADPESAYTELALKRIDEINKLLKANQK